MIKLATKPGWKNFFFLLLLWYAGITVYGSLSNSPDSMLYRYAFYTKFSWPNFVLTYVLAIWVIPYGLKADKPMKHILLVVLSILGYCLIRYLNNSYWNPDYYVGYTAKNETYAMSLWHILKMETLRGLQFVFIAYAYRLLLERVIFLRDKKELEKAKLEAELSALRYQLNPHFLFNSINSIYYLSMKKSDRTPDALLKLADILRYVLTQDEEWISIDKELEYISHMISFEKIRFPEGQFNLNVEIAPSGKHMLIPTMLLTPFVENAFKHGDPASRENPVNIRLNITDESLSYTVVNPVDTSNSDPDRKNGIGLENLRRRLNIIYKDKYHMEVKEIDNYFFAKLDINLRK
jgi:hypothetical protein